MTEQVKAKHTESPWELIEPMQHQGKWNIERWLVTTRTGQIIAKVGHAEVSASQANARLIVAAPEQHDALKDAELALDDALEFLADHPHGENAHADAQRALTRVRSAIAKAQGK